MLAGRRALDWLPREQLAVHLCEGSVEYEVNEVFVFI